MEDVIKLVSNILVIIFLLAILLFVATWSGVIKCNMVPGWCDIYYPLVGGSPKTAIIYGNSGLGDPVLLKQIIISPEVHAFVQVDLIPVSQISLGNLKRYNLVIVEKAKYLSADKLKMFMDYVNQGGRLVWVGDAGTEGPSDEFLLEYELLGNNSEKKVGVWARKFGDEVINFQDFLGVKYLSNYCDEVLCPDASSYVGSVRLVVSNHPLVFGAAQKLAINVADENSFSIVETISSNAITEVASVDFGTISRGKNISEFGPTVPYIVVSGLGERVSYYSIPPEYLFLNNNYSIFVENLYSGMLGTN